MEHRTRVVWDDSLLGYDFGPLHPMAPVRLDLTMRLARDLGVLDHLELVDVPAGSDDLLLLAHDAEYVEAVRAAGRDPSLVDVAHGLGTPDVPAFHDMHEVSSRVVAATAEAARSVLSGDCDHAVSPSGGLHHAMRSHASGFCVYNDLTVAIRWLLGQGVERVAYVDVDVHHGDGVEAAFWDDPRVLTVSLHESPQTCFPGTGWPQDIGGPGAEGYAVNVAVPPGTGDEPWLRAMSSVVPELLDAFDPQFLVSQHGCDTHFLDPLAHLSVSVDGQRAASALMHDWAHRYAQGRWVATGGGGYAVVDVVPRSWTHLMAEASGRPVDPTTAVPESWRDYVLERLRQVGPLRMTDGQHPVARDLSDGYDPSDPVDQAILATRRAVFPHVGLHAEPY
ncbi:MAG: acetoin utilization protein AcuC [Actinomycetes bacterium]